MSNQIRQKVVQKIIAVLKDQAVVTEYVGTGDNARIYCAHLSTLQDYQLPAVSIHILGTGRETSGVFADTVEFQIEPWFQSVGKDGYTWDDVLACHGGIMDALHRVKMWDDVIGIKILECTNLDRGVQIKDENGIIHYPSRWKVKATI